MKVFVVFSAVLAIALAKPSGLFYSAQPIIPALRAGIIAPAPVSSQFHAQDALGQYNYGYSDGLSAKQEIKSFDGITRGSYSYVDAEGKLQTVDYTADALNGFRVAGTNLPKALPAPELAQPKPIEDLPDVAAARSEHLAAIEEAKLRNSRPVEAPKFEERLDLPKPVEDTPEVAQAKAAHLAAKKDAELRNSLSSEISLTPIIKSAAISPISPISPLIAPIARVLKTSEISSPYLIPALRAVPGSGFAYSVNNLGWNPHVIATQYHY